MSIHAISWVMKHSQAKLGGRLVMLAIADHCDDDGENAWPSIETISHKAGMSKRQVQRLLPELVKLGELHIERHAGQNGSHLFRIVPLNPKGDNISPPKDDGATICDEGDDNLCMEGMTICEKNIHNMSPEPSLTVHKPSKNQYTVEFEDIWKLYPKREGSNSKTAAFKAWGARLKSGVNPGEIISGVRRYREFVSLKGMEGGPYVMQASTFFGPKECWREDWAVAPPQRQPSKDGKTDMGDFMDDIFERAEEMENALHREQHGSHDETQGRIIEADVRLIEASDRKSREGT